MRTQQIYEEYEALDLDKPYQEGATVTREELHKIVMKKLESIGNDNPHWNKLNDIETALRNWTF